MISSRKKVIRLEVLRKRDALTLKSRKELSDIICNNLLNLEEFQRAKVIHFFLTTKSEVMTEGAIRKAMSMGKEIVVPVMNRKERRICLSRIEDYDRDLILMPHGILEPRPEFNRSISLSHVELMVLPGVAFDLQGHRLGYGAGYYDRLLEDARSRPLLIGLAFEIQIVEEIPFTDHDVRMDKIVTEKRVIECSSHRS